MKQAQINSYLATKESAFKLVQQEHVLYLLRGYQRLTLNEISEQTNIRLSSVCARVNELVKEGLVTDYPNKKDTVTGRNNTAWGLPE